MQVDEVVQEAIEEWDFGAEFREGIFRTICEYLFPYGRGETVFLLNAEWTLAILLWYDEDWNLILTYPEEECELTVLAEDEPFDIKSWETAMEDLEVGDIVGFYYYECYKDTGSIISIDNENRTVLVNISRFSHRDVPFEDIIEIR